MTIAAGAATRFRRRDRGFDLVLGHCPRKAGNRSAGRHHQHRDRRGGPWIDLKILEEALFRLVGGIQHNNLRPFGILRIGLERLDALHRLLVELRLVVLHAEQDRMSVLDRPHALGRTWADERLLQLGLVKLFREGFGGSPGGSDRQHHRHGSAPGVELVHDRLFGGVRDVDRHRIGPIGHLRHRLLKDALHGAGVRVFLVEEEDEQILVVSSRPFSGPQPRGWRSAQTFRRRSRLGRESRHSERQNIAARDSSITNRMDLFSYFLGRNRQGRTCRPFEDANRPAESWPPIIHSTRPV